MAAEKKYFAIRGYKKSGTNWVSQLLNLHPHISCTGEFHWHRITQQLIETFRESENLARQPGLLDATWHSMDRFIKESISLACDPAATWVGDRTPAYIEPSIIIGARTFDVVRDGRDILVSAAFHYFNNAQFFPEYDDDTSMQRALKFFRADDQHFRKHPEQLLACEPFVRETATTWARTIAHNREQAANAVAQQTDLKIHEVRYETLHHDIERERARLYEFLDCDPAIAKPLEFSSKPGFEVEQPTMFLRKGVIGDWQNYFTPPVAELFNQCAGDLLLELEYARSLDWYKLFEYSNASGQIPSNASTSHQAPATPPLETVLKPEFDEQSSRELMTAVSLAHRSQHSLAAVSQTTFDRDGSLLVEFQKSAAGCWVVDQADRTLVDWSGSTTTLLGYDRAEVSQAIAQCAAAAPPSPLQSPLAIEVAEQLLKLVPAGELVWLCEDDAVGVAQACELARGRTGCEIVLRFGSADFEHEFQSAAQSSNLAAVIVAPLEIGNEAAGIHREMQRLHQLTREVGCLLIEDRTKGGFRLATIKTDANEATGDLICFGHDLANGLPLGAIVGSRQLLQSNKSPTSRSTCPVSTLSLTAAKTVLGILQREPITQQIEATGSALRSRLSETQRQLKTPLKIDLQGPAGRMRITLDSKLKSNPSSDPEYAIRLMNRFCLEASKRGVLTDGWLQPNAAHDDEAIAATVTALGGALIASCQGLHEPSRDQAETCLPANGFLEFAQVEDGWLNLRGWLLLADGAPDSIAFVATNNLAAAAKCVFRPDLQSGYFEQPTAALAGFMGKLPAAAFVTDGQMVFTIVARRSGSIVTRYSIREPLAMCEDKLTMVRSAFRFTTE